MPYLVHSFILVILNTCPLIKYKSYLLMTCTDDLNTDSWLKLGYLKQTLWVRPCTMCFQKAPQMIFMNSVVYSLKVDVCQINKQDAMLFWFSIN